MKTFPRIETERLILRQFDQSDLNNVFRGLSDPEVIRYYGVSFKTLEATKEQMQWFADLEKKGTGIWWAVCKKSDGAFVGGGGLNDLSKEHRKAEIGFWLLPEFWGKGIMKEAMAAIFDYSFTTLNLHRIEGFVESDNVKCKRAVEKVGFIYEGTMRECEVKNEQFVSVDIYARFIGL